MKYKCQRCGSFFTEAEVRQFGYCRAHVDGGGVCHGRVLPDCDHSNMQSLIGGKRCLDCGTQWAEPVKGKWDAGWNGTEEAKQDARDSLRGVSYALPEDEVGGITAHRRTAGALSGIVAMQRGGTFPEGTASAVLMFRSEDARAEFAALLVRMGVKVSGA